MTSSSSLEKSIEAVIFVAYTVISAIVLLIYWRHKDYLDSLVNRILALTFGFFLMLCAMTHLRSIWYDEISAPLSISCAAVSFVAAICTVYRFRSLDDYLTLRISTAKILRERTIEELTKGYDLRCFVINRTLAHGSINGYTGGFPVEFHGGTEIGSLIQIEDRFFRVVSAIDNIVGLTQRQVSDAESPAPKRSSGCMIYGYDATAEVHMSKEEERMNEMKMAMCMGTAHDVRTPLTSLGIVIESLRSKGDADEAFGKLLDEAFVNLEILNLVATQFMEIGRMGQGIKVNPTTDVLNVPTMANRIRKVCSRLKNENVETRCEVRDGVPVALLTDVEWVWQILMNLITNSAKYTYKGHINVYVGYRNAHLELRVEDTGIGIDDSHKKAVFEQYVTHQKYGHVSHGIGLHSVKMKVDALGGSCEILDNDGGGSIFEVKIPAKADINNLDATIDAAGYGSGNRPGDDDCPRRTCLIVDDTPSIRKMMVHILAKHNVELACNGAEGLDKLKNNQYDIVLLDMSMPVMDGAECLTRFRAWERKNRTRHQLIYSMSANVLELNEGFDGSLPKPMDAKRLRGLLKRKTFPVLPIG